jgi:hypothetical protein
MKTRDEIITKPAARGDKKCRQSCLSEWDLAGGF